MKSIVSFTAFALSATLSAAHPKQNHAHQHHHIARADMANLTTSDNIIYGSSEGSNMKEAPGKAIVKNNCGFDLFMESVNPTSPEDPHPSRPGFTLPSGWTYQEGLRWCDTLYGCGVSIKAYVPDISTGSPTQFEYTVKPTINELWYDISYVDCARNDDGSKGSEPGKIPHDGSKCPGWAQGSSVSSNAPGSGKHACKGNDWCASEIYWVDVYLGKIPGVEEPTVRAGSPGATNDIFYNLCSTDFGF